MKKNERKVGAILSYISIALYSIMGLVYVPLLLSFLSQSEYGLYQLMGSLITYLAVMDFGLSKTTTRYYSMYIGTGDKSKQETVLAISKWLYYILTIIIMIAGIILYNYIETIFGSSLTFTEIEIAKKIFVVLLINLFVSIPSHLYTAIINSNEKFIFVKTIVIVETISKPIIVVLVLSKASTVLALVIAQTGINFLVILIKFIYARKIGYVIKYSFKDKAFVKEILTFSFSLFMTSIISRIFWRVDPIILGIVSGTTAVAIYGVASQISISYQNLANVISDIFLPNITKLSSEVDSNKKLNMVFLKLGRLQYYLLLLILSGFIVFGRKFIVLWAGVEFIDSYYVILLILIPLTLELTQNIGVSILYALNKHYFRTKMYLIISLLNIAASVPLAIRYGAIGVAIASGVSYLIGGVVIMNIYYSKVISLSIRKFWLDILKISLVGLILIVFFGIINGVDLIQNEILDLISKIFLYSSSFIILQYIFNFNDYEKQSVKKIILRFKRICKSKNV